jgi:hypothetical protein
VSCPICGREYVAFREAHDLYMACPVHNPVLVDSEDAVYARCRDEAIWRGEPFTDEAGR